MRRIFFINDDNQAKVELHKKHVNQLSIFILNEVVQYPVLKLIKNISMDICQQIYFQKIN